MSARYCGRRFAASELELIRGLIAQRRPRLSRTALSQAVCRALHWRKPDGGLKQVSARVALLRMQRDGLLRLPAARRGPAPARKPEPTPASDPPRPELLPARLAQVRPLRLDCLRPRGPRSRLWNEFVERYHYLGHKRLPGAQLRYFVKAADGQLLGLLGFGAAAWKTPAGPLHRLESGHPRAQSAAGGESRPVPDPTLDSSPMPSLAPAGMCRKSIVPRLARPLQDLPSPAGDFL